MQKYEKNTKSKSPRQKLFSHPPFPASILPQTPQKTAPILPQTPQKNVTEPPQNQQLNWTNSYLSPYLPLIISRQSPTRMGYDKVFIGKC
ncbi:MAG: hypothetical protein IJ634_03965 [Bacteroidales bacterium]|nr:hypothetical protein [Bacteroidales bacterium]